MDPPAYPSVSSVPMMPVAAQGQQPQVSTMVQYTTVNIPTESPKDHIIWSIISFAYGNPFCLGLIALIYSIKARDRKVARDLEGARHYSDTARCFNIISAVLISICVLILIIVIVVTSAATHQAVSYYNPYG